MELSIKFFTMESEGQCKFCKKTFSGRAMTRHLQSCRDKEKTQSLEEKKDKIFLIRASAAPFWLYFGVNASSTLENVDSFLRRIWLECCGHLSGFNINSVRYESSPQFGDGDKSMNIALKKILNSGVSFSHEYDYGTTTQLNLKCISERIGEQKKEIEVIARNELPDFKCVVCCKPAKEICCECVWEEEGMFCEDCAEKHECGEEMLLPVVNSPRMGMCGYTGE